MKLAIVVWLCTFGIAAAGPSATQLSQDRIHAAEHVYKGIEARMKIGTAKVDMVYGWSLRWLDALLEDARSATDKKQALSDHLTRMKAIETLALAMKAQGVIDASDGDAATYFRIEAELWVARGKR